MYEVVPCCSSTRSARWNPATDATLIHRVPTSPATVNVRAGNTVEIDSVSPSPHTPAPEASTCQRGRPLAVHAIVDDVAGRAPSRAATRAIQQRRPPFSKNPRTAYARKPPPMKLPKWASNCLTDPTGTGVFNGPRCASPMKPVMSVRHGWTAGAVASRHSMYAPGVEYVGMRSTGRLELDAQSLVTELHALDRDLVAGGLE